MSIDTQVREEGPATALAYDVLGLNKIFPGATRVQALADIDLQLEEGSFTCIVGPSGCGKSTLLRILGGLETKTTGTIKSSLRAEKAPEAAFVFQRAPVRSKTCRVRTATPMKT
ncbi:ATP-binding cassette domain-containing protein [Micrococcoides hystricis]|uniref:ATP-binding cassette domain-containing protein n=1 Tax=Micrococcoides hystricis TaxID=1572761 RepID=A0ABV6PB85_9MICC